MRTAASFSEGLRFFGNDSQAPTILFPVGLTGTLINGQGCRYARVVKHNYGNPHLTSKSRIVEHSLECCDESLRPPGRIGHRALRVGWHT